MSAGTPFRTPTTVYRKAEVSTSDLTVTAVLTSRGEDRAGDVVHPGGLSFRPHLADPWVDLEHNGRLAGWARDSLAAPGGRYGLAWGDFGAAGRLPVGTTWFDPSDPVQAQTFALIERDALPGVSLEFRPVEGFYKAIGWSDLDRRPAYEFLRADVVRWTHCARPVNDGAWAVTKSLPAPDPLLSILSAGRLPGNGEALHPTVKKALARYTPARKSVVGGYESEAPPCPRCGGESGFIRSRGYAYGCHKCGGAHGVTKAYRDKGWPDFRPHKVAAVVMDDGTPPRRFVRFEPVGPTVEKAMNDDEAVDTVYDEAPEEAAAPEDAAPEAPAGGGIAALYTHAQALLDAVTQLEQDMLSSDSPELRKFGEKLKAKGEAIAEEAKAMADKHDAKLNGGGGEPAEAEGGEDDAPSADMETDDEGVLKAMRPVYRKAVRARRGRRFSKAEALAAIRREESAADKARAAELAKAKAELEAERRKFRRDLLVYGGE